MDIIIKPAFLEYMQLGPLLWMRGGVNAVISVVLFTFKKTTPAKILMKTAIGLLIAGGIILVPVLLLGMLVIIGA